SAGARAGDCHCSRGHAEFFFECLDHIVQVHYGHGAYGFQDIFFANCHLKLLSDLFIGTDAKSAETIPATQRPQQKNYTASAGASTAATGAADSASFFAASAANARANPD